MENQEENPFAALITSTSTSQGVRKDLVEDILMFTLHKTSTNGKRLLSLASIIMEDTSNDARMSEDLLSHALFERLLLSNPEEYLVGPTNNDKSQESPDGGLLEVKQIHYLYHSFIRCNELDGEDRADDCRRIRNLILTNMSTCLRQPEIFQSQPVALQWLRLFQHAEEGNAQLMEFLVQITLKLKSDEADDSDVLGVLKTAFYPMFAEMQKNLFDASLSTTSWRWIVCALNYFVSDKRAPELGEVLLDYIMPNPKSPGVVYGQTLIGQLLSISILPARPGVPYEYFNELTAEAQHLDTTLGSFMSRHQASIYNIFKLLLVQGPVTKKKTLHWLANCLQANISRAQLWSNMNLHALPIASHSASEAFMNGLEAVLLRLCVPLCQPTLKVMLVDPTYCAVEDKDRQAKGVCMLKANEETCLIPNAEENGARITAEKYKFISEIFYLTHKALQLGYCVSIESFTRMSRELHNLQNAYQDAVLNQPNADMTQTLLRTLKTQMQQYLCLRNVLMETENDGHTLRFLEASALWLLEIALTPREAFEAAASKADYAPQLYHEYALPDDKPTFIPPYLASVPEYVIDNIVTYLSFSRHFPAGQQLEVYTNAHEAFFKLIVLFMGNADLVKNPHLRAKLAEALEFLLPRYTTANSRHSVNTQVFDNHPDRLKLVKSLLNVFVSIEMTGQSVQFEQKFNYRRPMYAIMEFLWTKEEQVQCFRELAAEAEVNMEAIEPPLFLRFINLLINDAIFLLDESLSNLQQIRELQEAQARGDWNALPQAERQQHLSNIQHLGMLARFDNILGRDTINILKLLTTEIKSTFCHNSMVDRIASMLNYFLLKLVGPQKENFKVRDKKEFEFKPAETVLEICRIYVNLSSSDSFCLAVSQDGRSYSAKLFELAEGVLIRIGGGQLIGEMSEFALKVKRMEAQYKEEQEFMADAPDEFLDPIMSTLMKDPVILPSSKVTVDRSTIARHLLSDQTDPFNREPLTMDKIKPNEDLKANIQKWLDDKRAQSKASKSKLNAKDDLEGH